jgi:hypothetical protein
MFDVDVCLVCGRHLTVGHAYCSDRCEQLDTSPAISTCNSALSSPYLDFVNGSEIPSLKSGAMGRSSKRYSTSSSSTSSTSLSTSTDDEDDLSGYSSNGDCSESILERNRTLNPLTLNPALSYTRRPSGTSNHPTIPVLSRSTSSGSSSEHSDAAQSASIDRSSYGCKPSSTGSAPRARKIDHRHKVSAPDPSKPFDLAPQSSPKRSRNRASLPGYFSLLQIGNSPKGRLAAPILSTASQSPPTPTVTSDCVRATPVSSTETAFTVTSRGRSRTALSGGSSSRRSGQSTSRGRQRMIRRGTDGDADVFPTRALAEASRGRSTDLKDRHLSAISPRRIAVGGITASAEARPRGRVRGSELDGLGSHKDWPGYGNGRTGLRHREHAEALPALRW